MIDVSKRQSVVIYRASSTDGRLFEGELVSNLVQMCAAVDTIFGNPPLKVDPVTHPYAMIVTQDCDLESDFRGRLDAKANGAELRSILFCIVDTAEGIRSRQSLNARIWERLHKNKDERYQYLRGVPADTDSTRDGTPDLILDFKQYFTVPTREVYARLEHGELLRRARLEPPFKEQLATRFYYYQARVALPEEHFRKEPT